MQPPILSYATPSSPPRRPLLSILALLILVPAASLGTLAGLYWGPGTTWGQLTYAACKLILLAIPAAWYLFIILPHKLNTGNTTLAAPPPPLRRFFIAAIISGLAIATLILTVGLYLHHSGRLDPTQLRTLAAKNHLTSPLLYIAFALITTFGNAFLEEWVWRRFVTARWEELLSSSSSLSLSSSLSPSQKSSSLLAGTLRSTLLPATLSALCFTAHHTIILSLYFPTPIVFLGSLGVFSGALIWSLLFLRSRSILPGYLSHILADLAIFTLGYLWIL